MKKIILRIVEILIIIATIVITIKSIQYANATRGYKAYGGEYLIPFLGLFALLGIEEYLGKEK